MSLSLPPELYAQAVHLDDFHNAWPVWDEAVLPWDLPAVGGRGRPVPGWDPDRLLAQD